MKIYEENQFTKNVQGQEDLDNIHKTSVEKAAECIKSFLNYGMNLLEGQKPNEYDELEVKKDNISIGNINNIKKYSLRIDDNYIYLDLRFKTLSDKNFTKADLLLANTDFYEVKKKLTKKGIKEIEITDNVAHCHDENGKLTGFKISSLHVQIILDN